MAKFNTGQSFADGDTVTGAKLNNITSQLNIYTGVISEQTAMVATVSTADQLLIADTDNGDSGAANRVTVQKLLNDTLSNGTYTNAQLSGNLNVTQLSTLGTISSTRGTVEILNSTTGTIATLNSTTGTIATGTIATLNSTTGTIANLNSTTPTFLGAITASTNTINVGSGQIYKDASGNVGIGTASPSQKLDVSGNVAARGVLFLGDGSSSNIRKLNASTPLTITNSGGTPEMTIDSSGNVGIGTASPATKFHVASGNMRLDDNQYILWGGTTNGINGSNASNLLGLYTNSTERLRIDSAGQIGIGGANYGTSGQVLTSAGTGAAPSWQTAGGITRGTAVASTSGTAIDFTGIPSTVKRITVIFNVVSLSGSSNPQVQIGSGSIDATGYVGSGSNINSSVATSSYTAGFGFRSNIATQTGVSGHMIITNISGNIWVASGYASSDVTETLISGGVKTLSGVLDRIRITTVNGTDTFDLGSVNIMYE